MKPRVATVFKVCVWKLHGKKKRFSSVTQTSPELTVEYKLNEETVPKFEKAPLMAFSTYEDALNFYNQSKYTRKLAIFKCEASLSPAHIQSRIRIPSVARILSSEDPTEKIPKYGVRFAKFYWQNPRSYIPLTEFDSMRKPQGTVFCEWVRPIELLNMTDAHGYGVRITRGKSSVCKSATKLPNP